MYWNNWGSVQLTVSDLAAGAVAQCLSSIQKLGSERAQIKEGGEHVLRWLCHDSITLKKLCLSINRDDKGDIVYGPLNFEARTEIEDELFVPIQFLRP